GAAGGAARARDGLGGGADRRPARARRATGRHDRRGRREGLPGGERAPSAGFGGGRGPRGAGQPLHGAHLAAGVAHDGDAEVALTRATAAVARRPLSGPPADAAGAERVTPATTVRRHVPQPGPERPRRPRAPVTSRGVSVAPVGIFGSGVGGLTVARAVIAQLPHESVLYIGDTANSPYGPKPIA